MQFFLLVFLYATLAVATNIAIYPKGGCNGGHGLCKHVKQEACCRFNNGKSLKSANFVNMPARGVGGTFKAKGSVTCNTNTASREGPGCVNGPGKGAGWICCVNKAEDSSLKMNEDWECNETVAPNVAVLGGRYFNMGAGVPSGDAAELESLIIADANFENMPGHLKKYEIYEL